MSEPYYKIIRYRGGLSVAQMQDFDEVDYEIASDQPYPDEQQAIDAGRKMAIREGVQFHFGPHLNAQAPDPVLPGGGDRLFEDGVDAGLAVLRKAVVDNDVNLRRLARKVVEAYMREAAPFPTKAEIAKAIGLAEDLSSDLRQSQASIVNTLVDVVMRQIVENHALRAQAAKARAMQDALEHLAGSNLSTPHDFRQYARRILDEVGQGD